MNVDLAPDERVLKVGGATRYGVGLFRASYANGKLLVTNHRLIFKQLFWNVAFPLSFISRITEQRLVLVPVIQVDFQDGGSEQFSVHGVPEWIGIIEQAKSTALPVPVDAQTSTAPQDSMLIAWQIALLGGLGSLCGCLILSVFLVLAMTRLR